MKVVSIIFPPFNYFTPTEVCRSLWRSCSESVGGLMTAPHLWEVFIFWLPTQYWSSSQLWIYLICVSVYITVSTLGVAVKGDFEDINKGAVMLDDWFHPEVA